MMMMILVKTYEPKLPLRSACSFFIVDYLCGVAEDGCDGYMVMMILAMLVVVRMVMVVMMVMVRIILVVIAVMGIITVLLW